MEYPKGYPLNATHWVAADGAETVIRPECNGEWLCLKWRTPPGSAWAYKNYRYCIDAYLKAQKIMSAHGGLVERVSAR